MVKSRAFRHGVATTPIDRGASITTVGAQLRHSDPRITLGLYAHVVPQSQRDAVAGLASAISSGQLLTFKENRRKALINARAVIERGLLDFVAGL
jgi:hypothetical protein